MDITDGVEVWNGGPPPRLIGGRCTTCGAVAFPRPTGCGKCAGSVFDQHLLAESGSLWTFTIQRVEPKEPFLSTGEFAPFAVGYVDLGGEVLVEGRIQSSAPQHLHIGLQMKTVIVDLGVDRDGTPRSTFGFAPIEELA